MNRCSKVTVQILCCLVVFGSLIACVSTKQYLGRTKSDYDRVYRECIDALADVNYSVTTTDSKIGLIVAEWKLQAMGGAPFKMNIMVTRADKKTEVKVSWIPAPGTIVDPGAADKYIQALKKRIPDIEISVY